MGSIKILSPLDAGDLALSQSIEAKQFGEPELFSAPKLTDAHRETSMPS